VENRPEGVTILLTLPPETDLDNVNTNGVIVQEEDRAMLALNEIGLTVITFYFE